MIFYPVNSKIIFEINDYNSLDNSNSLKNFVGKICVIKFGKKLKKYFLGFFINGDSYFVNPGKKVVKIKRIEVVDVLNLDLKVLFDSFFYLLNFLKTSGILDIPKLRYFYSSLDNFILKVSNYSDLLKFSIDCVVSPNLVYEIFSAENILADIVSVDLVENDFLNNYTLISFKLSELVKNVSKVVKEILKILKQKILKERGIKGKVSFLGYDYSFAFNHSFSDVLKFPKNEGGFHFTFFHKGYDLPPLKGDKKMLVFFNWERIEKRSLEDKLENFINLKFSNILGNNFFVFPLGNIFFSPFFDTFIFDYFPNFHIFVNFLEKYFQFGKNIVFYSYIPIFGDYKRFILENKEKYLEDFRRIREKLIFEDFSLKDFDNLFLSKNLLFFSYSTKHYRLYCSNCDNSPYCENCGSLLDLDKRTVSSSIDNLKLICRKCKLRYDIFNCQYCGVYKWKLWSIDYKKLFSKNKLRDVIFVDFLPFDFSLFLEHKNYVVVIDYFSLSKPFIIRELNIWYILFKIVNELVVDSIVIYNNREFDIYQYFHQFIYDEERVIEKLISIIEIEKRFYKE